MNNEKSNKAIKFYVTGGIFNNAERRELDEISDIIEMSGFDTYVPHRDGFEFVKLNPVFKEMGLTELEAEQLLGKIIFTNDVFQVINLAGVVFNMNGRVPDDGATVESSITWMTGNLLCIYKDDCRCLIDGIDNPLIDGLVNFNKVNEKSEIPGFIASWLEMNEVPTIDQKIKKLASNVLNVYRLGEEFDRLNNEQAPLEAIAKKAISSFQV